MKSYTHTYITEEETDRFIMVLTGADYTAINLYNPPDENNQCSEAGRYVLETAEDFDKLWNFLMSKEESE